MIDSLSQTSLSTTAMEPNTFPGVFIRAPIIDSLLLPQDIISVEPAEATKVARGQGEAHENLAIRLQHRTGDGGQEVSASVAALRPPLVQQYSSYSSATSASSASSGPVQLAVAPPLERAGEERRHRPRLEILASLSHLPRGAKASVGGHDGEAEEGSAVVGSRPEHDSMIVALKQGRIMCTSFHPELTGDARLHEFFLRSCVLAMDG